MRGPAVLLVCAACGVPGPTPNGYLAGDWSVSDGSIEMTLIVAHGGLEGAGQGQADSTVPAFTVSAPEWGRMTWTFADGRAAEYAIEPGPQALCPGDASNTLGAFTIATMQLKLLGGTLPIAQDELVYSRTPPIQFACATAPH